MNTKFYVYLSLFFLSCIIILNVFYKDKDISLYPVKNTEAKYSKEKIWLISYANKGVYLQNQNNLVLSATMYQTFDVIIPYTSKHIDAEYYATHKNILNQNRGAGYWLWKPYFIMKTLNIMEEGDILVYVDSSGVFRTGIYDLIDLAKQKDFIVFPNFHTNRGYVKKIVIDKMVNRDDSYLDKTHLDGSIVLIKNNAQNREIVAQWLKYCEDEELLTDIPSTKEYSDFKDHRHDQAILSIMYNMNPEKFHLYEKYPARMESFVVTRRKTQCSMLPVTFSEKTEFSLIDDIKYRSLYFLIGCQRFKGN